MDDKECFTTFANDNPQYNYMYLIHEQSQELKMFKPHKDKRRKSTRQRT